MAVIGQDIEGCGINRRWQMVFGTSLMENVLADSEHDVAEPGPDEAFVDSFARQHGNNSLHPDTLTPDFPIAISSCLVPDNLDVP